MKVTIKDTGMGTNRFSVWKVVGDASELLKNEDGSSPRFPTHEDAVEYCNNKGYTVI